MQLVGALDHLTAADCEEADENLPDRPDKKTIAEVGSYIKASSIVLKGFVEVYGADVAEELEQLILDLCGHAMLGFPTREGMQDAVAKLGLDYLCSGAQSCLCVSVQLVCIPKLAIAIPGHARQCQRKTPNCTFPQSGCTKYTGIA
jgi:hypothetical protein